MVAVMAGSKITCLSIRPRSKTYAPGTNSTSLNRRNLGVTLVAGAPVKAQKTSFALAMHAVLDFLFGLHADSHTITAVQLTMRAVAVFFAALVLLRLSGKHTFGGSTAFDMVVKIMLGAVLSRAIVAASPFWGTLGAGLVFVLLHRLLAWAAFRSEWVGRLVKGEATLLAQQGQALPDNLRQTDLSEKDLLEGLREQGNLASIDQAEAVYLERDGSISVVKKKE
jgi:hypothetical protein